MATVKTDVFTAQEAGKMAINAGLIQSSVLTACAEYEASALAANDVIQLVRLPKGAVVKEVVMDFDDLGTGTSADIGDSDDADRYIDGADTATAAGTARLNAIAGRNYRIGTNDGDDVLTLTNLGGSATGTIKVTVFYAM